MPCLTRLNRFANRDDSARASADHSSVNDQGSFYTDRVHSKPVGSCKRGSVGVAAWSKRDGWPAATSPPASGDRQEADGSPTITPGPEQRADPWFVAIRHSPLAFKDVPVASLAAARAAPRHPTEPAWRETRGRPLNRMTAFVLNRRNSPRSLVVVNGDEMRRFRSVMGRAFPQQSRRIPHGFLFLSLHPTEQGSVDEPFRAR